ncbi:PAS domain-containing protein [Arenibaculum sp.]|jgi:hypothetical protein|uniref:PAS domain-containing protein n=1 Tax=Arenibaculum sp. TaxID=2865862 RepID=UPI002E105454|nr:PAS domain-containing protein [Arenibaculum sp.]
MTEDTLTLRHPKLLGLHAHWLERAQGGIPLASDLDPAALRPWLGNLLIMDIGPDGDFVYSYYGQNFAENFRTDRAGQSIAELPDEQRRQLRVEYESVRDLKRPAARLYTAEFDGQTSTWERLVLPLSEDGETVSKILVGAYRIERPSIVAIAVPRVP